MPDTPRQHIPNVVITTPKADRLGLTPNTLTRVTIDGVEWAVTGYQVKGHVNDMQEFTLTFLADVTIVHRHAGEPHDA